MRTLTATFVTSIAICSLLTADASAIVIDSFAVNQTVFSVGTPQESGVSPLGASILGMDRDIELNNSTNLIVSLLVNAGEANYGSQGGNTGVTVISWDGTDGDPLSDANGGLDKAPGLGDVDLTDAGASDTLRLGVVSDDLPGLLTLRVWSSTTDASSATINLPGGIAAPTEFTLDIPTDFGILAGGGADFTSVNAIELEIDPLGNDLDLIFDFIDTVGDGDPPGNGEVPEPSALAIWPILLGLGSTLGWRRRRRARG